MKTGRPQLETVIAFAVIAVWVGLFVTPAFAQKAFVPQTGQVTSYAPGDDGDLQAGVRVPMPRFIDHGNGTVEDKLTRLIWLKHANCFGVRTWAQALTDAGILADGSCGLSDRSHVGDWRLPNVKELQSVIDFRFVDPAFSNAAGTSQWTEDDAFSGVESTDYWSSTTVADAPSYAWLVRLSGGNTVADNKSVFFNVWPVRGK